MPMHQDPLLVMIVMASQITDVWSVCPTLCSGVDQRKHQSSTSLAFVRGIYRWPVDSPHKGSVTWKMFPFDDVIMGLIQLCGSGTTYQTTTQTCAYFIRYTSWRYLMINDICLAVSHITGLILGLRPANKRCLYFVTLSLIGWLQT